VCSDSEDIYFSDPDETENEGDENETEEEEEEEEEGEEEGKDDEGKMDDDEHRPEKENKDQNTEQIYCQEKIDKEKENMDVNYQTNMSPTLKRKVTFSVDQSDDTDSDLDDLNLLNCHF
jgi:hypothetical protein